MNKKAEWLTLCCALMTASAHGYEVATHERISEFATGRSALNDSSNGILATLCSARQVDDRRCLLRSSSRFANTLTPVRLIREGAVREDDGDRAANHFFDPQNKGRPLTYSAELGDTSPDWALEDLVDIDEQARSYGDAKKYLHAALTGASAHERDGSLGLTFESLGHVIHHLQDMAQPQHARNDVHCDRMFSTMLSPLPLPSICAVGGAYRPSAYEGYTQAHGRTIDLSSYETPDYGTFTTPRAFWQESGSGIAEFTSNNFLSVGTNVYEQAGYMLPDVDYPKPRGVLQNSRQITDPDILGPQGPNQPLSGEIRFVATAVVDNYRGPTTVNPRAATYSIFDEELKEAGEVEIFTLNSLNYAAANAFLLPRAAAYSTGLINYFFRGRIEIGLPEQGVYGIIDHATTNAAGQGFRKLKLKLRNASPDGVKPSGEHVPQTMEGGTLVAVAKYTLNSCYQPDLSGDFAVAIDTGEVFYPAFCSLDQYFAGEEQISQSNAIVATRLDTEALTEVAFDFSSQPIPVNARDLRIQVVYTGQLGSEPDGIAFGGRDISEPTHLVVYNNSDYYAVDGKFYTPAQIRSDSALSARVAGHDIDPSPLDTVSLIVVPGKQILDPSGAVPVNGYVRVAVLAEADAPISVSVLSRFEGGSYSVSTFPEVWPATTDLRGEQAYITPFGIYRGTRGHFVDVVFKANSSAPLLDGELVTMSSRTVADPGPTPIPLKF